MYVHEYQVFVIFVWIFMNARSWICIFGWRDCIFYMHIVIFGVKCPPSTFISDCSLIWTFGCAGIWFGFFKPYLRTIVHKYGSFCVGIGRGISSLHIHERSFVNVEVWVCGFCVKNPPLHIYVQSFLNVEIWVFASLLRESPFHIYKWLFVNVEVWISASSVRNFPRSYLQMIIHKCKLASFLTVYMYRYIYVFIYLYHLGFLLGFPCLMWMFS